MPCYEMQSIAWNYHSSVKHYRRSKIRVDGFLMTVVDRRFDRHLYICLIRATMVGLGRQHAS